MAKNQHYVPRFLLRNFSEDNNKKCLTVYHIGSNKIISNAPLKYQASEDYIYGSDQLIEQFYQNIENDVGPIMEKINTNIEISQIEKKKLKGFIHYQLNRTLFAKKIDNEIANVILREHLQNKNEFKQHLDSLTIELKRPLEYASVLSMQTEGLLYDLRIAILENNTNTPFLLGQNPVYVINPYLYEKHFNDITQGIVLIGTCLILPISFYKSLLLYDPNVYSLIKNNKDNRINLNEKDVDLINCFQFYYTLNSVYIKKDTCLKYLCDMAENTKDFRDGKIIEVTKIKQMGQEGIFEKTKIPITNPILSIIGIKLDSYHKPIIFTEDGIIRDTIRNQIEYLRKKWN